jgi:hypothetical protein
LLSCVFDQVHVVLFEENHISDRCGSSEVGNPGTLGMKERATVRQRVVAGPKHQLSMEPLPFPCHPDRSEA